MNLRIDKKRPSLINGLQPFGIGLFAFIVVFQPPISISIVYVIAAFSIVYLLAIGRITRRNFLLFVLFSGAFAWLLFSVAIYGTQLSNISHFFWMTIAIFPAALSFSNMTKEMSFEKIFHILLCVSLAQAIIAYLSFFSTDVNRFFQELMIKNNVYSQDHLDSFGYRIYGYGTSLMYAIPIVQGLISAWAFLFGILKRKWYYYIIALVIFVSAVINAKIAIIIFVAAVLVSFFCCKELRGKRTLKIFIIILLSIWLLYRAFLFVSTYNYQLYQWLNILFDEDLLRKWYIDYYTDASRLALPESIGIIIGTGGNTRFWGHHVDMGFINDIWLGGIPYFAFTIIIVGLLAKRIWKNERLSNVWNRIIGLTLFIAFLIADVKGIAFTYSGLMAFFMMMAFI